MKTETGNQWALGPRSFTMTRSPATSGSGPTKPMTMAPLALRTPGYGSGPWASGGQSSEQQGVGGGAAGTAGSHTPLNEEDQELLKTFRKEVRSLNLPQQFPGNIQIPRVSSGSVGPARRNELCAKGRFEPPHRDTCGSSGSPRVSLTVGTSLRTKAGARFARWLKGGQGCVESPRAFYKQEKALCPTNSREQHRFLTGVGVTPHSPPLSCQETGGGGSERGHAISRLLTPLGEADAQRVWGAPRCANASHRSCSRTGGLVCC